MKTGLSYYQWKRELFHTESFSDNFDFLLTREGQLIKISPEGNIFEFKDEFLYMSRFFDYLEQQEIEKERIRNKELLKQAVREVMEEVNETKVH